MSGISRPGYETDTLLEGKALYGDRGYLFTAPIPASVHGATYIRTRNDDKNSTEPLFLQFTISHPATITIAYDERDAAQMPDWLQSGWTLQVEMLNTTDGGTRRILLSRNFPAGVVSLGPNRGAAPVAGSMYNVIITPTVTAASHWASYW